MLGINPSLPLWVNFIILALAGSLGSLLGSLLAYWIGYVGGRPLMLKYGKYVLISQHDADKADAFFSRWGTPTAFFSRMLPVVRTYISLPAGITKMNALKFSIYTFLGSLPWCLLLTYLGYQLGKNYEKISGPLHYVDGLIVVLVVVLVVLYVWRHIRNDRRARAEHVAAESTSQTPPNPWGQPPFQGQAQQPVNQPPFQGQAQQPMGRPPFQGQQIPPSSPQQPWGQPAQSWGPPSQPNQQQWGQPQPNQQQPWGRPAAPAQMPPPQGNNPGSGNGWPRQ